MKDKLFKDLLHKIGLRHRRGKLRRTLLGHFIKFRLCKHKKETCSL